VVCECMEREGFELILEKVCTFVLRDSCRRELDNGDVVETSEEIVFEGRAAKFVPRVIEVKVAGFIMGDTDVC